MLSPSRGAVSLTVSPLAGKKRNSIHWKLEDVCEESWGLGSTPAWRSVCMCSALWDGAAVCWTEEGAQMCFWTFIRRIRTDSFGSVYFYCWLFSFTVGGWGGWGVWVDCYRPLVITVMSINKQLVQKAAQFYFDMLYFTIRVTQPDQSAGATANIRTTARLWELGLGIDPIKGNRHPHSEPFWSSLPFEKHPLICLLLVNNNSDSFTQKVILDR